MLGAGNEQTYIRKIIVTTHTVQCSLQFEEGSQKVYLRCLQAALKKDTWCVVLVWERRIWLMTGTRSPSPSFISADGRLSKVSVLSLVSVTQ